MRYKSSGGPHCSAELFFRKVAIPSLPQLSRRCSSGLRSVAEHGCDPTSPQSHSCLICAYISEIPSRPPVSCYRSWLSLLLSVKTCEEQFAAETSPVQLISLCLGERSSFWLIWAKPSLEECSCCTSLAKPHRATCSSPHLSGLSLRYWSWPWAQENRAATAVHIPPVSRPLPPKNLSQVEQGEKRYELKVVFGASLAHTNSTDRVILNVHNLQAYPDLRTDSIAILHHFPQCRTQCEWEPLKLQQRGFLWSVQMSLKKSERTSLERSKDLSDIRVFWLRHCSAVALQMS